jgi:hypothetical protein
MSIRKPSTFPVRPILNGSEEIYTQTNGVSEKFLLGTLASYVTQNADEWLYKEIFISAADMYDLLANPIVILDEADLGANQYFEINRIIIESKFNNVQMVSNGDIYISYKASRFTSLNTSETHYKIPNSFIEAPFDSVLCFYSPYNASVFRRGHGLFIDAFSSTAGEGDTDYFLKIYYKIVS